MALRDSLYLFIMNYTKLEDCLFLLRDCLTCLSGIGVLVFYAFIFVLVHSALVPDRGLPQTPEQRSDTLLVRIERALEVDGRP